MNTSYRTETSTLLTIGHRPRAAIAAVTLAMAMTPWSISAADDEEDEIPFSVANVFFELNNTDGDLGIHALIDGDPWKRLEIEDPNERKLLNVRLKGRLRRQGLTELFFESAEPPFESDDPEEVTLTPEEFFERFPEGEYEVSGRTLEGDELESTAMVTHLMPAPADNVMVNGSATPEDCDDGPVPMVIEPFVISWDAVTLSHPEIGRTNEPITVDRYEVVVEREEPAPLKFTIDLPPDVTTVQLPAGLTNTGEQLKLEVLVREASGNQTAVETCFGVL
jgi:hypothetical protein